MRKVIILGSSRQHGETKEVIAKLVGISNWDFIDLSEFNISHFDYEHQNRDDDFIGLMKRITDNYDVLIFATPVYWYAMSGIIKVFFDRLTSLLRIEKTIGRKLRNKHMAVISCSNGDNLEDSFWLPFKKSAAYLGMNYIASLHTFQDDKEIDILSDFVRIIDDVVLEHRD